jgi:hypothetical protein
MGSSVGEGFIPSRTQSGICHDPEKKFESQIPKLGRG